MRNMKQHALPPASVTNMGFHVVCLVLLTVFTSIPVQSQFIQEDGKPKASIRWEPTGEDLSIFGNGVLATGYEVGVNTSGGRTDWVKVEGDALCMTYPSAQSWGAVFITTGPLAATPRPAQDLSGYSKLSLELRGKSGGESVWIGLKDNTDPDDGTETKIKAKDLTTAWKKYEFNLSDFTTADLKRIYIATEFVFDQATETGVCTRNIEYLLATGVEESEQPVLDGFLLQSVHPNPTRATVTLTYDLPAPATMNLRIFDVLGREVRHIDVGQVAAGERHQVRIEAGQLPPGLYFLQLEAYLAHRSEKRNGSFVLLQ